MDFWDIYYDYYERVKRFIFALVKDEWVADDLVQETFIKVQKNLNQLRDDSKLSSWIFMSRSLSQNESIIEKRTSS
jgi:RNA polymerase sigma-70 factor (ECF subfamily)